MRIIILHFAKLLMGESLILLTLTLTPPNPNTHPVYAAG